MATTLCEMQVFHLLASSNLHALHLPVGEDCPLTSWVAVEHVQWVPWDVMAQGVPLVLDLPTWGSESSPLECAQGIVLGVDMVYMVDPSLGVLADSLVEPDQVEAAAKRQAEGDMEQASVVDLLVPLDRIGQFYSVVVVVDLEVQLPLVLHLRSLQLE